MVIYQQAAELYPTPLRNEGMSISATISSTVGIFLPYIMLFDDYGIWFPMMVVGLTLLLISIVSFFVPETLHCNLPQTIAEAEVFGKDVSFWSLAK